MIKLFTGYGTKANLQNSKNKILKLKGTYDETKC